MKCDNCGQEIKNHDGIGTGYALVSSPGQKEEKHCYDCCHAAEIKAMKDRSGLFTAYLSCDGKSVTSWPGGILGQVISSRETAHAFGRRHSINGKRLTINVKDVHGELWHGKGYAGVYIHLYPMKG